MGVLTLPKPLDGWLKLLVEELELSDNPNQNMVVFRAAEARRMHIRAEQMGAFLEEAYREYSRKTSRNRQKGWFYAWFDEMSDTLRCSFYDAPNAAEVPFRCKLIIIGETVRIADLALASTNDQNLRWDAFRPTDVWEDDDRDSRSFELTVFARRVLTLASW